MGISAELISIAFGLAGVIIALATYWTTRKRNIANPAEPDVELGLLEPSLFERALLDHDSRPVTPSPSSDHINGSFTTSSAASSPPHNSQLHEMVADTLVLLSRHMRSSNST
ncbi:hypothetical protein VTL71DRAFT_4644 [Oculimacula yallundae]|uniref:Uncharacterized protein n=1 Tax=Oculimacula yallundae TaxID=86028 RepID=A0ABR4C377_9HELO